jgi:F-type H+-transporting ATPase subunit epsilon
MEKTLAFKIATPEKVVYEDEIFQVSIPTLNGEITVLPGHIPLISIVQAGELRIKDKEGEHHFALAGGFVEVRRGNELIILADNAERAEAIDIERAEEARTRAEAEVGQAQNRQDVDFARLQAVIDREMNRVRVGKKYKDVK